MFRFSWIARGGRWKCFCFHSWNETAKSATLFPNFPPISPPNAGKYRHFRPRLHRAVLFCQLRGFEVGVLRIPTILCCFGTFYDFIHPQATPPVRTKFAKCESATCGRSWRNGTRRLIVSFLETRNAQGNTLVCFKKRNAGENRVSFLLFHYQRVSTLAQLSITPPMPMSYELIAMKWDDVWVC